MDFKKIGEAALRGYHSVDKDVLRNPLQAVQAEEDSLEAAGRAAVAAMIPGTVEGRCSVGCPFLNDDNYDWDCTQNWQQFPTDIPGPNCPAGKKEARP